MNSPIKSIEQQNISLFVIFFPTKDSYSTNLLYLHVNSVYANKCERRHNEKKNEKKNERKMYWIPL